MDTLLHLHRINVVDAEGQDILIIDGIDDGVGMQFLAKRLWSCS